MNDRIRYGDPGWDDSMFGIDERNDRPATEAEAHAEWHANAGVPMGQPGCPWDCCDPPDPEMYDEQAELDHAADVQREQDEQHFAEHQPWLGDADDLPF